MKGTKHIILAGIAVVTAGMLFGCDAGTTSTKSRPKQQPTWTPQSPQDSTGNATLANAEVMVRVQVYDDTDSKPLHDKAEIWFRGHGSWWLKPETKFGAAAKNLGRRKVGEKDSIALYPDSRDGQEIRIPFSMTAEMNPNGSARDSIIITIGDNEIEIVGLPVEAATGDTTMKVKRGG